MGMISLNIWVIIAASLYVSSSGLLHAIIFLLYSSYNNLSLIHISIPGVPDTMAGTSDTARKIQTGREDDNMLFSYIFSFVFFRFLCFSEQFRYLRISIRNPIGFRILFQMEVKLHFAILYLHPDAGHFFFNRGIKQKYNLSSSAVMERMRLA